MSTLETKQTHTPGALRAAWQMTPELDVREMAAIIDRETGALEMLEALEGIMSETINGQSPSLNALQKVYAAIHKAKGEQP